MKRALLFATIALAPMYAAVDGTVVNGTTGQPQPNAIASLVQPGDGGMKTLVSVKTAADGKFQFTKDVQGPQLVQVFYQGVLYTKPVMPGMPSSGIQVQVFDSTNDPAAAPVSQHFIVLQPSATELNVSEGVLYQSNGKMTYSDPVNGSFRFYLPPEAKGQVSVTINSTGGMPIQRPAEKTKQPNIYKIDYPIKPGETRFDLNYILPASTPMVYATKILHTEGASDLVIPNGVTVTGSDIELAGKEPKTQASIYKIKNANFKVEVQGTGTLQAAAGGEASAQSDDNNGAPTIQEVKPRIYERLYWILGMAFAILALGSVLLYRSAPAARQ